MLADLPHSRWNEDSLKKSTQVLQQEQEDHNQAVYKTQN